LLWSEAERKDVTHNRISNTLMQEALDDPTPAAYNPFNGGVITSNVERALVDVYRKNTTDLKLVDFKISRPDLFNLPAGPVGFLAGFEYREESYDDDRDPRLDGTIQFTTEGGVTFPFVSDVANSSPSSDSSGSRDVTSLFAELAVPVWNSDTPFIGSLDMQLAMRYEDLSDVGDTTVGKVAFGWRPFDRFLVRGSWSEAFRAPNLITVNEGLVVRTNTVTDEACAYVERVTGEDLACRYGMQRRASGSQDLVPEESTNTSIGAVWDILENLTVTLDFWTIEKKGTIGLFGEGNHSALDLLLRLEAGLGNCGQTFNPALGREDPTEDEIAAYLAAGICPAGTVLFVNDRYANLDTRTVEGHDIGIYYDVDTGIGDFSFKYVGSFYDTYKQTPGPLSQQLLDAAEAGIIPPGGVTGFGDLIGQDGNQDEKHNASIRWSKGEWASQLSVYKLGSFYQSSLTLTDGTKWVIPSMTTYNISFDYNFDLWRSDNRIRLGINNFTDERAPLADRYFGYFADAHRDYGRYWYLDLRMRFN
jgi:outer membrane receptor protein involved in Fe transport